MSRVCLLVPALQPEDAIGNDVAGMFAFFRQRGVEAHVLAQDWTPQVALPVEPFSRYAAYAAQRDTISIYHHSTHWADADAVFLAAVGPKILRYHAITPPAFFAPYCAELTHTTAQGYRQTARFAGSERVDLFLADSEHNARELQRLGAPPRRCAVSPPFHVLSALADLPADAALLERYLDGTRNVLFVGRVAPNKGHRHLLGALAASRQLFGGRVRLLLVGDLDPRLHAYHVELSALAEGLRVADRVVMPGRVSAAQLKAYYLLAHAFLVMSEHEGFCVPVVEAMAHGVAVVAYDATAVGETVGDAGIVLRGLDYDHYAAALEVVCTRADVRESLRARAQRRVGDCFSATAVARRFEAALAPWLAVASRAERGEAGTASVPP
jgi:glycosyltransferase involved in cell wall biosynthesis